LYYVGFCFKKKKGDIPNYPITIMDQINDIKYFVVLGISIMVLLFTSFLLALIFSQKKKNKYLENMRKLKEEQQNQLIQAAVRSEETERHRIAETLHDEVGAILSATKLHLLSIKTTSLSDKEKSMYEKGGALLNDVIKKVRNISHNMHSSILQEYGLQEAIIDFVPKVAGNSFETVHYNLDENYQRLKHEEEISIYRTVQELINNIIKYADARTLTISTIVNPPLLALTIFHNGNGITQKQFDELSFKKEGLGLKNIRNRLLMIKGDILFAQTDQGYTITLTAPYSPPQPLNHAKN
jgi:two-component system, NarL family, sensor kinase